MKIFLIRHGEADSSIEGIPLTDKGILEAESVSKELLSYDIEKVYSSDMKRARDTAKKYLQLNKKEFVEDERLREVYRVLIGGPIKEGTSEERVDRDKKRADEFFEEIIKNEKNTALFCHGNIIRYFLNKVLKSKSDLWTSLEINNCSISTIEFEENELKIGSINSISHLTKDLGKENLIQKGEKYIE